jgi:hypothetical protein
MSHHSDDAMLIAGSDSFWEPGNYKKTTKRTDDGNKLFSDLTLLIKERADIEQNYGKSLRTWSKKWNELIEKGPEYGTTEAAWKAVLSEAERRCDLHMKVKDNLSQTIISQIKQWQKDNFHTSMFALKEKKEFDDAFKKVFITQLIAYIIAVLLSRLNIWVKTCVHCLRIKSIVLCI